jgi:hypothetical protein
MRREFQAVVSRWAAWMDGWMDGWIVPHDGGGGKAVFKRGLEYMMADFGVAEGGSISLAIPSATIKVRHTTPRKRYRPSVKTKKLRVKHQFLIRGWVFA